MLDRAAESLPIIYRDDRLIAIHKPAGLLVHRSVLDRHETRFALQMLRDQIGQPVYPAHRLDKGTSGVLLFALDRETGRLLNSQFERGEVSKRYVAVVRGYPPASGDIDHPLQRMADEQAGIAARAAVQPAQTRANPRKPATAGWRRWNCRTGWIATPALVMPWSNWRR